MLSVLFAAIAMLPLQAVATTLPLAEEAESALNSSEATTERCMVPLHISNVESDDLLKALQHIKECAPKEGKLDVYISGPGGSTSEAQAFYDQMRTLGLSSRVRFKSYGMIASASNIVWMAADERITTPSTMFILHKASVNIAGEDPELGVSIKDLQVTSTTNAVRRAAGETAARLWKDSLTGKIVATAFDGRDALKNGWATALEDYVH